MNLQSFSPHLNLTSSKFPSITPRHRRRRRLRPPQSSPELRCQLSPENLINSLLLPHNLLPPILLLSAAAAAAYLHRPLRPPSAGEWALFATPTPFNRCVLLRCPSVSLNGRGGIPLKGLGSDGFEKDLKFQRVCVRTDDGGVISLDWPDHLDLEREQGLDTTVLIVPGTAEGSMDWRVRLFVLDVVKNGSFPLVMNPRGCAGSALTTARLVVMELGFGFFV